MKIAIITLPLHTNYGGILQAYALQTVLKRMGHQVTLIEPKKRPLHHKCVLPLVWLKRALRKYLLGKDVVIFKNPWLVVRQYTDVFINKYIQIERVEDWDEKLANSYDAFVVGSDQIWRPCCCPNLGHAFLDFTKNKKVLRLSYAASFGTSEQEYSREEIALCKDLIRQFDIVSVRETSGVNLIKDYFDVESKQVLDPTMLLSDKDYIQLFKESQESKSEGNLLVYVLDQKQEITDSIKELEKSEGLKAFYVNSRVDEIYAPITERIQPPVERWLRGFYDAEFIVTDSFHACVFSILFHKPFVVFVNKTRGMARFLTLLEMFHMEDRLVYSYEDYRKKKNRLISDEDFKDVDRILGQKRNEAFELLKILK